MSKTKNQPKLPQKHMDQKTVHQSHTYPVKKIFRRNVMLMAVSLLVMAIVLTFFVKHTANYFQQNDFEVNDTIITYMLDTIPDNIDQKYIEEVEEPLETIFDSSMTTSFFFRTPSYPAGNNLLSKLKEELTESTNDSTYISATVVYASATNTFVTNEIASQTENETINTYINDIIYNYNSNTLEKIQLASDEHNTFLFKYKDYIIFSKDLTTASGSAHGTVFAFFDIGNFNALITDSYPSVYPYTINVYDPYNHVIYSDRSSTNAITENQLINLATKTDHYELYGHLYQTYFTTNALRLQYILEIDSDFLPGRPLDNLAVYFVTLSVILLMVIFTAVFIFFWYRKPTRKFFNLLKLTETDYSSSLTSLITAVNDKIRSLQQDNKTLSNIVSITSVEALSSLFTRLIIGQEVADDEISGILNNTNYGFGPNNLYVVGLLSSAEIIENNKKYRIINLLNIVFDKFKSKTQCNMCVFPFDDMSFAIIVSFTGDTSIAKGKTKVNELNDLLVDTLEFSNLTMDLAFGHMYNSILDLSFSYNEAYKDLHHLRDQAMSLSEASLLGTNTTHQDLHQGTDNETVPIQLDASDSQTKEDPTEASEPSVADILDRRAHQITQVLYEGKEGNISSLIDRTLKRIFKEGNMDQQFESSKHLLSAMIQYMISYPLVNDSNLTDVYGQFASTSLQETTPEDLAQALQEAVELLCSDFAEVLKRQHNPYVIAAQEYIAKHYTDPDLSLNEIADSLQIAPNYLSSTFSKNLGKKLFAYINEYRLTQSIDMLLNTNKTINDISLESGFSSARNYIRIFKKYKDITPGAYRKHHMQKKIMKDSEE